MPTVVLPNQNNQIISDFIDRHMRQQQADVQAQQNQQAQQDQVDQFLAKKFLSLPPDQQQANFDKLPPGPRRYVLDTGGYTPHTPTTQEQADEAKAAFTLGGFQNPKSLGPGGEQAARFRTMTGADAPTEVTKANVANTIYGQPNDYAPQMQGRQLIEDKYLPTGGEQLTVEEQRRHNTAEEGQTGPLRQALAAEAYAGVGEKKSGAAKNYAETRKANAEAQIQEAKAKMMKGDPSAPNAFAQGVMIDPQSYYGLTEDEKAAAAAGLGGRVPSRLNTSQVGILDASVNGLSILKDVKAIADKWQKRGIPITGPYIGRYNATENKWGDQILPNTLPPQYRDEYMSDIAALQENLTINILQEAKANVGARPAYQITQLLQQTSPALPKSAAMFNGSLDNMMRRYQQRVDQIERTQWKGQPPSVGGTALPTGTSDAPSGGVTHQYNPKTGRVEPLYGQ